MSFITAAVAGGTIAAATGIGGAIIQGNAANSAAEKQAAAAREANALQERMYNQTRADHEPWRAAGAKALAGLGSDDFQRDFTAADFQQDPAYAFRMQEGQKALERSAAARGGLQSGGTLKAIARYGQDFASNEYSNAYNRFNADRDRRFNRLSSIAGFGVGANAANANAGQNYASTVGDNTLNAAKAAGAADIASGNAWSGALSGVGQFGTDVAAMGAGSWMKKTLASMKK